MDFWLSDDEAELQVATRTFVAGRFPLADLAAIEASSMETGAVVRRWDELAAMGVFSMRHHGLGARDAVLVFEELGRGLVPGPLVATHLAAGIVDGAASGERIVGLLEPRLPATLVEHAADATSLLWFTDGELRVVDTSALELRRVERPLDALSPVWETTAPPAATTVCRGDEATALWQLGVVLTAALQLGVAVGAVELATEYAKQRHQFCRAIGSFQAVKHLLADMLARAEVARSSVYAAACALDAASDDDPRRAASAAKVVAGDAALFCARNGIQVHGGMGFTWEVDAQRYWKRAIVLDATFGSSDHHAGLLAVG